MKLSITARLTLTTAVLTLLFFVPVGVALYVSVGSEIQREGVRASEDSARSLAYTAFYQWDDNLLVQYKGVEAPVGALGLNVSHWALTRGDGRVLASPSGARPPGFASTRPGGSWLVEHEGLTFRVGSVPLTEAPSGDFSSLPDPVQQAVRRASPKGVFLRAKREVEKTATEFEVDMLEPDRIVEIEVAPNGLGTFEVEFKKPYTVVPADLRDWIVGENSSAQVSFADWKAYQGQLIAIVQVDEPGVEAKHFAVNRLGERFLQDEQGEVVGHNPAWRLWMVTARDASAEMLATQRLLLVLAFGFPLLWGAVVLVGWYVTRRAMSPVKRIVETVEDVEVSRLDKRLPVGPVGDELDRISATINNMLARLEEGYARERQFTGDASHELRNPLAKVIADIDVTLKKERDSSEYRETLVRCRGYARGMERLVESLLWLARLPVAPRAMNVTTFELADLAAETVGMLPAEEATRVRLELDDVGRSIHVRGKPELIRVLLQNLLQNALRYSPGTSPVTLRLAVDGDLARIDVQDHGDGIPEEDLEHVFSRFFRVDRSRARQSGGFGLGLAIVEEIAKEHGADVRLRNQSEGGLVATFHLELAEMA